MNQPRIDIALFEPEIPGNAGSIGRTCVATASELYIVGPTPFEITDTRIKRAGLDYWPHVRINHWDSLDAFLQQADERHLHFLTTKTKRSYTEARFCPGDRLIFGKETKGLPEEILTLYSDRCLTIPMTNPHIRSLNLAMAAGIVLYEALRQIRR